MGDAGYKIAAEAAGSAVARSSNFSTDAPAAKRPRRIEPCADEAGDASIPGGCDEDDADSDARSVCSECGCENPGYCWCTGPGLHLEGAERDAALAALRATA